MGTEEKETKRVREEHMRFRKEGTIQIESERNIFFFTKACPSDD
jgi:hypothetical protein